jgi:hypothetical protein
MTTKTQTPQLPPELQQQLNLLNMRIANSNLANADLLREIETTFKQLLTKIIKLEQENTDLKNKHKETNKKPIT